VAWLQRFAGTVNVEPRDEGWLPCSWDKGRFDVLWLLQRHDHAYRFAVRNRALLEGDEGYRQVVP
jgi:hypothetical protein